MLQGFSQAIIITIVIILIQTTKCIYSEDLSLNEDEKYVLILTKDNFTDTVKNSKYLLVKFVAPWCGHCKVLQPAYAAAAKQLAESNNDIKLATVDATIENELAKQFDIKGYPTMKFFSDGTTYEYTGGREQDAIVNWLKKKTGPAADELKTVDDLNKFKESSDVVIIGAFKDVDNNVAATAFLQVAKKTENLSFGITTNADVLKELKIEIDTIVLLKKFDEGRNDLTTSLNESTISEFIQKYQLPLVIDFSTEAAQKIFGNDIRVHILLFINKKHVDYEKYREEYNTAARHFRGKTLFVLVDSDDVENERVQDFFGIKSSDLPSVRLISLKDEMNKYKPDTSDVKSDVLIKFVTDFFDDKLKPHLLSQELPADWDKNTVKILVGSNFDAVAFDKAKTVLVSFIAPWCGHCKQMAPIYEQLAENYKSNPDVIIAKIDSTLNELEKIKVDSFPTIKLFPKDSDDIIDYYGQRTFEGLSKFIDSRGKENGRPLDEGLAEESKEEPIHEDL